MNIVVKQFKEKPLILWGSVFILSLMFSELFFFKKTSDWFYFLLTIIWYLINKTGKIDGRFSVVCGLVFLSWCPFLMLFSPSFAQKSGIWSFLLLFSGVILIFSEVNSKHS